MKNSKIFPNQRIAPCDTLNFKIDISRIRENLKNDCRVQFFKDPIFSEKNEKQFKQKISSYLKNK